MKIPRIALSLLVVPISCAAVLAQSSGNSPGQSARVSQAHCQYAPDDPACGHRRQPLRVPSAGRCTSPAPCPFPCCQYGYPLPSRPPLPYAPEGGTHAVAGALVGLGLGALLGASKDGNADSRLAGALVIGGIGALIGATVGHGIPARHWRRHRPYWDDADENSMAAPNQPNPNRPVAKPRSGHSLPDPDLGENRRHKGARRAPPAS